MKKAKPILVCYVSHNISQDQKDVLQNQLEEKLHKTDFKDYFFLGVFYQNQEEEIKFKILKPENYEKTTITND